MTQNDIVLKHLKKGPITALEAMNQYGIMRLGARILELKQAGHKIDKRMVTVKNRFGQPCRVAKYFRT